MTVNSREISKEDSPPPSSSLSPESRFDSGIKPEAVPNSLSLSSLEESINIGESSVPLGVNFRFLMKRGGEEWAELSTVDTGGVGWYIRYSGSTSSLTCGSISMVSPPLTMLSRCIEVAVPAWSG